MTLESLYWEPEQRSAPQDPTLTRRAAIGTSIATMFSAGRLLGQEKVLSNEDLNKPCTTLQEWYASEHIEGWRKQMAGRLASLSEKYKSPLFAERRRQDPKVIEIVIDTLAKAHPVPKCWAKEFADPTNDREMNELISKVLERDAVFNFKKTYRVPTGTITGTVLMDYIREHTVLPFTLDPSAEKELAKTVLNITEDETRMWAVLGEALERSNKLALRSDLFADNLPSLLHIHPGPEHATQHSYTASNDGLWIRRVVRKTNELGQPIFDPEKKEFEQVTSSQNFLLSDWDAKLRNLKIK